MRKLRIALLVSVCMVGPAMAQRMDIDLSKLPPDVATSVLKAEQERKGGVKMPTTLEEAEQYSRIGQNVATAISATAKGLSLEVNEFVKTPVGWWAAMFVFFYFIGFKVWHIVGGIIFFIVANSIVWKSFKHFHFQSRVLVSENGTEKKYDYKSYPFKGDGKIGSALLHTALFIMINLASLIIVF